MTSSRLRRRGAPMITIAAVAIAAACSRAPATDTPAASGPPASSSSSSSSPSSSSAGASGAPVRPGYTGELPPLPEVQFASARPAPITRAAYEFAARHPEILRYMPCFCGCEKNGHGNNEDCFVARREADGRPVWSPHGIGCGICIDVAREAARLHKAGVPLADVRAAIDRKYSTEYPTGTPTPKPPRAPGAR